MPRTALPAYFLLAYRYLQRNLSVLLLSIPPPLFAHLPPSFRYFDRFDRDRVEFTEQRAERGGKELMRGKATAVGYADRNSRSRSVR